MMHQVMAVLSEAKFGEDETDYFKRQMQEHPRASLGELREACRLKYKQLEVANLIQTLQGKNPPDHVMQRAMVLLLKEVFFL
jgi:hypothetical protein